MDYEHANALEWDLNQGGGKARQPPEDDWEVVGGSKKQPKVRLPQLPAQSSALPSSSRNGNRYAVRGNQSYRVGASRPSAGGSQHGQPLQPAPKAPKRASENPAPQQNQLHRAPSQAAQKFGKPQNQPNSVARSVFSPPKQNQPNQMQKPPQQQARSRWTGEEVRQHNAKQRRPPPKMTAGSDNPGEHLWRERKPAQGHVRIPIELAYQDKGHLEIAKRNRTFILRDGGSGAITSLEFGVWGDPMAVEATMKDIRARIEEWQSSQKSKNPSKVSKFSKVCSLTPVLRARAEKDWEKEVKKHRYRQFPSPDKGFEAIGSFHWPVKEYKPEEILGSSYEALDPIRMDCKCYVVFDKEQGLFRIMGRSDAVRTGLKRLRGTYLQVAARQVTPLEMYLIHDADETIAEKSVMLQEYNLIGVTSGEDRRKTKTDVSPRWADGDFTGSKANEDAACRLVISRLSKLHYYHGSLQMRLRLGMFLATRHLTTESGIYTIEEYRAMLRESAFHGEVTQELGDKAIEAASLGSLKAAKDFLTPRDPMTEHLSEVKPLYTALFTFNDPNNAEAGDIRLTITWQETTDAYSTSPTYEQVFKKWTRLDQDTGTPSSILDTTLSDLRTGMAWQFEIHAAQSIEESKLPAGFSDFGDNVKPEANAARKAANPSATEVSFVTYRPSLVCLKHLEQRLSYCFGIVRSDYTVELSRFQHRRFSPHKVSISGPPPEPTVFESRWGLSVFRIQWDTEFTRNERLSIGEKADWSHEEDVWFPPDYSVEGEKQAGFTQMMEKLKQIKTLVMEAKEENLMGGMKIG